MSKHHRNIRRSLIVCLTWILAIIPLGQVVADERVPNEIRVSLFIDERGTIPVVTLQAEQGLDLGLQMNGTFRSWYKHASSTPIRLSLDQYRVILGEQLTRDAATHLASQARSAVSGNVYISPDGQEGSYRVITTGYASHDQASTALQKLNQWVNDGRIEGPDYVTAGTYESMDVAKTKHLELLTQNINAELAVHGTEDEPLYSVWVNERDEDKLSASSAEPIESSETYMIIDEELMADGQQVPRIRVAANETALRIQSLGGYIQVEERFGRSYRGEMELLTHKNQLALINELPFEHYLYSVVGSEMGSGWPAEALKAQAVSARTFALKQGTKYTVAHVSDTIYEQSYQGVGKESDDVNAAVDSTKGEVIIDDTGELITPFYSSNAGGMTAEATEVWSNELGYLKSVPSPDDGPQKNMLQWNRVLLEDGKIGYVRSDYTEETGEVTTGGLKLLTALESNVNVRPAPFVNNTINGPIAQLQSGDSLILLETRIESNNFQWITIPYRGSELKALIESRAGMTIDGPLTTLQVTKRGPSARVIEMEANGQMIQVSSPDAYRTVMNDLKSTRFEVEDSAYFSVLGADGERRDWTKEEAPHVISADGETTFQDQMLVLNPGNGARLLTREPTFTFTGTGYGHGVGMSQWGARELAEFMSYDYKQIIDYYYKNVTIES